MKINKSLWLMLLLLPVFPCMCGGGGKGKSKKVTVGYSYFMAGIFGLCIKAEKLLKLIYGDRVAWQGEAKAGSSITVNAATLFGGEGVGGSGGLQGTFYFNNGSTEQNADPVMQQYLGEDCPAHRGIATLSMASSYVASFSPAFRPLRCLVQNLNYDWYTSKQTIEKTQINPIHEIRDVLLNPDLSGQYTAEDLDDTSFRKAADTLYEEKFGLSPKWTDSTNAQTYIQNILSHIDGVLVRDRSTGKIRITLLRGGYDADTLPVIGVGDFSKILSLGAVSFAAMQNKVTIKYIRMTEIGEESGTLTAENMANIEAQEGRVNATEISYPYLTDAIEGLAGRILARELRARSYPLKSFTLKGVSRLSNFQEGDLFVFSFPEQGIAKLVCRVLEADYGTLDDHAVTLSCTEDIYGAEIGSIANTASSEWGGNRRNPEPPAVFQLQEVPLYILHQRAILTQEQWQTEYPKAGFVMSFAQKNTPLDMAYTHKIVLQNAWESVGNGDFCESVILTEDVDEKSEYLPIVNTKNVPLKKYNFAFLDNEMVEIISWDSKAIRVTRGILDTLPQKHQANARIWLPDMDGEYYCLQQYTENTTAQVALATINTLGTVPASSLRKIPLSMRARAFRPYPPAGLAINGVYLADEFEGKLNVSWKHRDRVEQIDSIVAQNDSSIGPEEGTTYTVRVFDENDVLKKTVTGITGVDWSWDSETEDCHFEAPKSFNSQVRIELEAVRDGYTSWQKWNHIAVRTGEPEPPVVTNYLLAHLLDGNASSHGITASIENGILTLNGTVTSNQINVKITDTISIEEGRPITWDTQASEIHPTGKLRYNVTILDGSFTVPTGISDSFNCTLRYSTASIFVNCKCGDGMTSVDGIATSPVMMGVIFMRKGITFTNLRLRMELLQME